MTTRSMPVPEGLAGMRVDAGLARLLGTVADRRGGSGRRRRCRPRRRTRQASPTRLTQAPGWRCGCRKRLRQLDEYARRDRGHVRSCTPTTTSSRSTSRPASRRMRRSAGAGRRCSAAWPQRVSASAPRGSMSAKGIVHRLDVGTSGVMVVAISERAYTVLKRAFKQRTVEKRYHALVQGHPDPSSGTIDAPIGRHRGHDWKFAVTEGGRHSVTHYDTLEASQAASLLDVELETGRTHQIRVHFAALHHPCCRRPDLRRRPHAGEKARAATPMAARPVAGVRASRRRAPHRDHQPLPGRSAARARRTAASRL